jgi:hypothetical protein
VRLSFLIRLTGEKARLATLADALGAGAVTPALTFGDLEGFAHRLRGAAAVFDYPELRDAAKGLELAANEALVDGAAANEIRVRAAMRFLGTRLDCLTGGSPPMVVAMAPLSANQRTI